MNVFPDMICCKPMRQQYGLGCDAIWMACCLAEECAKQPTLEQRRRFAENVKRIKRMADQKVQEIFRDQVGQRFRAKRNSE